MVHHFGVLIKVNIIQIFSAVVEKSFHVLNKIIVQLKDRVSTVGECDVYSKNKYGAINDECLLIDIRLLFNYLKNKGWPCKSQSVEEQYKNLS